MAHGVLGFVKRWLAFLLVLGVSVACDPADFGKSPAALALAAPDALAPGSPTSPALSQPAELAPYEIKGETVYVNNRICAMSRSPMQEAQLGTHVTRVEYHGTLEKFKGKTLVFNQCCPMCVTEFPKKWAEEQEQIMLFHGLT